MNLLVFENILIMKEGNKMKQIILISLFLFTNFCYVIFSQVELNPEEIYNNAKNSIVYVYTYDDNNDIIGFGSGVVISNTGIIYTNYHVINSSSKIEIRNENQIINDVKIIGFDNEKDVAVLKIPYGLIPALNISNSEIKIGQKVYSLGNPLGYENTFAEGIISGIRKNGEIQFTAPISEGSSGGALLNSKGELIGISNSGYLFAQNINFAVPIDEFKKFDYSEINIEHYFNLINQISNIYLNKKDLSELNDLIEELKNYSIKNKFIYYFFGKLYDYCKKYDSSLKYYTIAIDLYPNFTSLYFKRAKVYENLNLHEEALYDINQAIQIDINNHEGYLKRGKFYKNVLNNYKEAIKDFSYALEINPKATEIYSLRSECYLKINDTIKALNDLNQSYGSYLKKGKLNEALGNFKEAIYQYSKEIEYSYDNSPEPYLYRADCYFKTNNFYSAINDYKLYLTYHFDNEIAFSKLAYSYLNIEEYENAEKYFNKSIKTNKYSFYTYLGLAILNHLKGKTKKTIENFAKAIELKKEIKKGFKEILHLSKNNYLWSENDLKSIKYLLKKSGYKSDIKFKKRKKKSLQEKNLKAKPSLKK